MTSLKEFQKLWTESGKPSDIDSILSILSDSGLDSEQIKKSLNVAKIALPKDIESRIPKLKSETEVSKNRDQARKEDLKMMEPTYKRQGKQLDTTEYKKVKREPVEGDTYQSTKNSFVFDGNIWINEKTGKSLNSSQSNQVTLHWKNKSEDYDYEPLSKPENIPTSNEEIKDKIVPEEMEQIANILSSHPKKDKIKKLLSSGDELSMLALEIILSEQEDTVENMLISSEEQR